MKMDKVVWSLVFAVASLFSSSVWSVEPTEQAVQRECTELVLDYAYYRDRRQADAVADLFASDGILEVPDGKYLGQEAIRERLSSSDKAPVTRHMMSTIRIFPESATSARGVSYATIYMADDGALPITLKDFAAVGEYHDTFVLTQRGWKISQRKFVRVFVP